ncbi:outer membrane protein OmpK [Parendozoicomonas sp. Alg238-R29]|uniref:nucleoside-specific channel-forming Tsx family protein n=1 Tax=Parendozoicomonas sp. Alg238-R29 TaxID=2993446 RepID=UPI00248DFDAC|nr:outer membrane protein OmpK [Parendozoicomonas sp. Alg238-R29]
MHNPIYKYVTEAVFKNQARRILILLISLGLWGGGAYAADYRDGDIHKNDFKWLQFNLMQSYNNKLPYGNERDTYFEMEFGGRNGIFQLYGYLDVFDIFDSNGDDLHDGDNFFFKFAPRISLDALFHTDLSFGPVKEVYISNLLNVGDRALFDQFVGLGVDVEVPWFGLVGTNLMARYSRENFGAADESKWSGYIWTSNWFKPFYFFENKSFIAYQGYLDYKFKYDKLADSDNTRTKDSVEWYHGFYWHSDQWSLGYGLKYYKDMANFKDGAKYGSRKQKTTGFGNYFAVIYKF